MFCILGLEVRTKVTRDDDSPPLAAAGVLDLSVRGRRDFDLGLYLTPAFGRPMPRRVGRGDIPKI